MVVERVAPRSCSPMPCFLDSLRFAEIRCGFDAMFNVGGSNKTKVVVCYKPYA